MKYRSLFIILILSFLAIHLSAREWVISDSNLEVSFNDKTIALTVLDKRCNKTWEQVLSNSNFTIGPVSQKGNSLSLTLTGNQKPGITIALSGGSSLVFSISADPSAQMSELSFPSPFKTPDKDHYLVETDGEGLLLPVDDTEYPLGNGITYYCGGGLSMAWMGVVDNKFETGYMAILETPYDAALRTRREEGLITFSTVWLPSMGCFGYERKVTYIFFDKGGYVAQCKNYMDYIWQKNSVRSLTEKQKRFPAHLCLG